VKLQVEELEKKLSVEGINEADSANLNKRLEKQRRLIEMLSDEIDFRNAVQESEGEVKEDDNSSSMDPFSGVDAVPSGNEEEEKKDENGSEETSEEKSDDEKNPDEDETIELS
jgi:hypothetical protein